MKVLKKIFKLVVILLITVSILLFSASVLLHDKVGEVVIKALNNNVSTKMTFGTLRLALLRKFPKASLDLKDVVIHSSDNFFSDSFNGINTDTLIWARQVSVEFMMTDILKGIYNIESIGAKDGKIFLYSDSSGQVNYDVSTDNNNADTDFTIALNKINLTDMEANYYNMATNLAINCFIENSRIKSRISGDNIDFSAVADIRIDTFRIYDTKFTRAIDTRIDLDLQSSARGVSFKKGSLFIEDYSFDLNGFISSDDIIDINITGNNIDISKIRNYLPEKLQNLINDYNPSGILILECKLAGTANRISTPHIEIQAQLKDGQISYGKSSLAIENLSFDGSFTNGSLNLPKSSLIGINNFRAKLGSSDYNGSLKIENLNNPEINLTFNGSVFPAEIKNFLSISKLSTAQGSADFDVKISMHPEEIKKIKLSELIDSKPNVRLKFNSLSLGFNNDKTLFENIGGALSVSSSIQASGLVLKYKGHKITVNGNFDNIVEWLTGRPVQLTASADISSDKFTPESLFNLSDSDAGDQTAINFPRDMLLDINFTTDSLLYKSITATKMKSSFNYKPGLITFKSMNMNSLNGIISGNGFIVQNSSKEIIARANFNLSNIDVKKAFSTYNNFGQDFLRSENIEGILSGSFSFLMPMDSLLNPRTEVLTAEGKFRLSSGALIDFDPVKELSDFIELSELENIRFETLENDFFIRNNALYVPQMDVKSSAVDLSVNGEHKFTNDYEYHIKMLLSEILSKKRKKIKSNITEFGVIEDDGLGRTSLLLKIESKAGIVKVAYDIKAVTKEVKNDIKAERQTLKSILNQEYGWYDKDSTIEEKAVPGKPRFRISWDETDSVNVERETEDENKPGIFRNILKKN